MAPTDDINLLDELDELCPECGRYVPELFDGTCEACDDRFHAGLADYQREVSGGR